MIDWHWYYYYRSFFFSSSSSPCSLSLSGFNLIRDNLFPCCQPFYLIAYQYFFTGLRHRTVPFNHCACDRRGGGEGGALQPPPPSLSPNPTNATIFSFIRLLLQVRLQVQPARNASIGRVKKEKGILGCCRAVLLLCTMYKCMHCTALQLRCPSRTNCT